MLSRRDFIRRLVGGGVGIALAPSVLLSSGSPAYVPSLGTNAFGAYDPTFYANEALAILRRKFKVSRFVCRTYDDRWPIGDTVTIRLPKSWQERT